MGNLDAALGVELGGHVLVDGVAADQNGTRVHTLATGEALDRERRVDDAAGVVVLFIGLGKIGVKQILLPGCFSSTCLSLTLGSLETILDMPGPCRPDSPARARRR